ncbi:MAG: FAD-dependent oxidoreductase, partial [Gemmatimonadales bacterium]
MKRDLSALERHEFDVLVVGGGIFGIAVARDAVQRGLRVALVERGDFAHATSANSFRIVHGGIRYLQHGDLVRLRESCRERRALLRVAPHLVHPLPIVVPTYGRGVRGRALLGAGFALYDLLAADRNRDVTDPDQRIPRGQMLSRVEVLELFPNLESNGLTGGGLFYDAQMRNPPRLALAFLRAAADAGAHAANYVEVTGFIRRHDTIGGVLCRDILTGQQFALRSRMVVNATGPWAEALLRDALHVPLTPPSTFSRDACFVVPRPLLGRHALAVAAHTRDPDAIVSRQARHLFLAPWGGATVIGTWHTVHSGPPDRFAVTNEELAGFVDAVNTGYPALRLTLDDVSLWNAGLVLFGTNLPGAVNLRYGKRSRIVDHARVHSVAGLVTVIGVRFTTARAVAEAVVNLVGRKLGRRLPACTTATAPADGGAIEQIGAFLHGAVESRPAVIRAETMHRLVHNYGAGYRRILRYQETGAAWLEPVGASGVLRAEIAHAVREE